MQIFKNIALALLVFLLYAPMASAVVYGQDERIGLDEQQIIQRKLTPVVHIFSDKRLTVPPCTGTWISDRHILTARHCAATATRMLILSLYSNYLSTYRANVKRVFVDRRSPDDQNLWFRRYGLNAKSRGSKMDWAVLEIVKEYPSEQPDYIENEEGRRVRNLERYGDGAMMGTFPIISDEILETENGIRSAAYHFDADDKLYTQNCLYRPRGPYEHYMFGPYRAGLFEFDCDMMTGASGSPILSCVSGRCKIVGVFSAEYPAKENEQNYGGLLIPEFSHKHGNAAIRSREFMTQVKALLRGDLSHVKSFDLQIPKCKLMSCLNAKLKVSVKPKSF